MSGEGTGLQFVDADVLVYAHDNSAGQKHTKAKALVEEFWQSGTGCLSVQVLQEFYVAVTRKVCQPLSCEAASRIVECLSSWCVHAPTAEDVLEAIKVQQRYGISFWDAMIVCSANALGCGVILSEGLSAGQRYGSVKVVPFIAESNDRLVPLLYRG